MIHYDPVTLTGRREKRIPMTKEDIRPEQYQYYRQLVKHVGGEERFFDGSLIYPRQLEIHLPGDHRKPCIMQCIHCQGGLFDRALGRWEATALSLLQKLERRVPYHIYGGAYTEPVINPYLMAFLGVTKFYGNHFGIHTSGAPLWSMQQDTGWLDEMLYLGEDEVDYISFSLDAGSVESHKKGKGIDCDEFTGIMNGIEYCASAVDRKMSVRLCYLLNRWNSSKAEIEAIVEFAKCVGVDSLRFSIPYAKYNQDFEKVEKYKAKNETPKEEQYRALLAPHMSTDKADRPYIFYVTPEEGYTDIALYDFHQCIYGYYQITLSADGHMYKCSAISAPDMKHLRLGRITDNIEAFEEMNKRNQNAAFDAQKGCFQNGGRCNRMAVECNRKFRSKHDEDRV